MPETTIPLTYSTTLSVLSCGECEIPFAIPASLHKSVRQTGATFHCPNGHKISYGDTENDRLKAKAERENRWRREAEDRARAAYDQAQAAHRSAAAYKGRVTRLKNRAAAGVCPCCNRSFEQLRRHMETKHPGFTAPDA